MGRQRDRSSTGRSRRWRLWSRLTHRFARSRNAAASQPATQTPAENESTSTKGTGHSDGYYLMQAACCIAGGPDGGSCLLATLTALPRMPLLLAQRAPVNPSAPGGSYRVGSARQLPRDLALALIAHYQRSISARRTRPVCPFQPSCSTYAAEAVEQYGLLLGGSRAANRLLRCRPGTTGGQDPLH